MTSSQALAQYSLAVAYLGGVLAFWAQLDSCERRLALTLQLLLIVKPQNCLYLATYLPRARRTNSNLELTVLMVVVYSMNTSDPLCTPRPLELLCPLHKFRVLTELLFHGVLLANLLGYGLLVVSLVAWAGQWLVGRVVRVAKRQIRKYSRLVVVSQPDPSLWLCSICLDPLQDSPDTVVRLRDCRHHYHRKCLQPWLRRRFNCPVCRVKLETSEEEGQFLGEEYVGRPLAYGYAGEWQHDYLF